MRDSALLASHVDVVCGGSVHGCGCGHCQCTWVWVWPLSVYMGVGVAAVSVHGCGCGRCQCTWVCVWPLSVYMGVGVAAVSVHGCGCGRCQCTWVWVWPLSVYMGVAAVSVHGCGCGRCQCFVFVTASDVCLVGGSGPHEGRVEVYHNGTWGTVCGDGWDLRDATVVCRQLGNLKAEAAVLGSARFGAGSGPILFSELSCIGNESVITECGHGDSGGLNCSHNEDVGVVCEGQSVLLGGYYLHLLCVCFCMHWPHKTQWLYDCKRYTFCLSPGPLVSIRCCTQRAGGLTALTTDRPAEATFTGEACVVHSTLSFTSLWSLLSSDTAGCPNLLK